MMLPHASHWRPQWWWPTTDYTESTDYRLSLLSFPFPFPLPSTLFPLPALRFCRSHCQVYTPLAALPFFSSYCCSHKRLQLHANKPSVFVSVFVSVWVRVCLHLRRSRPAKWRPTEPTALPSVKRQRRHWVEAAVADAASCQLPVEAVASCTFYLTTLHDGSQLPESCPSAS